MNSRLYNFSFYAAWVIAVCALLGSLYFSNILNLPPCVLCWFQRICMYPLSVILTVGILRKDRLVAVYGLPLAAIGWVIAFYHNLLYYNILPESVAPCTAGISCTTRFVELGHIFTIPLLSGLAFTALIVIFIYQLTQRNKLTV
jgi:disulfide bond formation protein DsbB